MDRLKDPRFYIPLAVVLLSAVMAMSDTARELALGICNGLLGG